MNQTNSWHMLVLPALLAYEWYLLEDKFLNLSEILLTNKKVCLIRVNNFA